MFRLIAILYVLVATVLAGVFVTAVLSLGHFGRADIALSALAGAVVALPVAWIVGKHLFALTRSA
ncbi:MAG TPA: hypothetical protein VN112_16705 [Ensifer sp.]|nr:hypothetical protein [Ensifer sp.]